jgi:hypothetical protein
MGWKDKLSFDTTDADTLAASDKVGAFVYGSDGTLITHTSENSKDALDVHISNTSITVTATNLDIRDLAAATDSVSSWLKDGTGNALTSTVISSIRALDVNIAGGNLAVDLNGIYNVSSNPTPDNVGAIFFSRAVTPGLAEQVQTVTAAAQGSIIAADVSKIHALDVSSFLYAKDAISGDLKQLTMNATDSGLNVHVSNTITTSDAALANAGIANDKNILAVANTAQSAVSSVLANRKYLMLYNKGNKVAYLGTTGVSATNGFPLSPGSVIELRAGASVDVKWVASDTNQELRSLELA